MRVRTAMVAIPLTIVVALCSGYALGTTGLYPVPYVALGLAVTLSAAFVPTRWRFKPLSIVALCFTAAMLTSAAVAALGDSSDGRLSVLTLFACILLSALLLTAMVPAVVFRRGFLIALESLTWIAVGAHLWFVVLGRTISRLPTIENVNDALYANGFLFFLILGPDGIVPRSMSIFWEPGLYASVLAAGLLVELTHTERAASPRRCALFVVAILLTFSTAGYILLVLVAGVRLVRRGTRPAQALMSTLMIVIVVTGILFRDSMLDILISISPVFDKLTFEDSTRLVSPAANMAVFSESPLLGHGLSGAAVAYEEIQARTGLVAQTSTSTYFLASFGIAGIFYTVAWAWGIARLPLSILARLQAFLVVLIIINKEPHGFILLTYLALYYLLSTNSKTGTIGQ